MAVDYLFVAGGGGGGAGLTNSGGDSGGGGGGGEVLEVTGALLAIGTYTVTVAGTAAGTGNDTSVTGPGGFSKTLNGGGAGGAFGGNGGAGGSGGGGGGVTQTGGSSSVTASGLGSVGGSTSSHGGRGAGGGGATAAGSAPSGGSGGAGGAGHTSSIDGTSKVYGSGGGGGGGTAAASGGSGAGNGAKSDGTANATAPTANRGGGGGGGAGVAEESGGIATATSGAAGVVIFRYPTGTVDATGGSITASGGYTIHTFTTSSTFTINTVGFALSADAGSFALTGATATFRRALRLSAAIGSFALSGTAANLKSARRVAAAAGTYVLTGATASFTRGTRFAADAGSFALSGAAATFRRALRLSAAAGAFLHTGGVATLRQTTPSRITLIVGGTDITPLVDLKTAKKEETADLTTSNTCSFEFHGDTPPTEGADITIYRATSTKEFGGTVLKVKQFYYGIRHNIGWLVRCQDYTWQLNDEYYCQRWPGAVSASTIAAAIVNLGSGFTTTNIAAGLPTVDDFEIVFKTRGEALQMLRDRINAQVCRVDYDKDVHFRLTPAAVNEPTDITDLTRSGDQLARESDLAAVRTRQRGLGIRVRIPVLIPSGSTVVAVDSPSTLDRLPTSGQLLIGSTLVTYTNVSQTQAQSGVNGIASAPTVALASSPAGGVLGAVRYAITFETPDGEYPLGTQSSEVTGATISAPSTATLVLQHEPTGTFSGTPPGDYFSATSVTISRSGTQLSFSTSGFTNVVAGARVNIFNTTSGVWNGVWTIAAVVSSTAYINGVSSSGPGSDSATIQFMTDGPLVGGQYSYKLAWLSKLGISALSSAFTITPAAPTTTVSASNTETTGGALTLLSAYTWFYTVYSERYESSPESLTTKTLTGSNNAVTLNFSQLTNTADWDDLRVRGLRIYRGRAGEVIPRLVADFTREHLRALAAFAGAWTYTDTTADTALGGLPAAGQIGASVGITGLPSWSDGRITGLMILRTIAAGSDYYVLATIGNSGITTFLDNVSDADLVGNGAAPADAFGAHCVALSGIATGPAGTTARNGYRLFNGVWRYCFTIPNNTDTTFTDAKADVDLGQPFKVAGYLTGLSATTRDIVAGETGKLHVVRNDAAAQAVLAAALGSGHDGVREGKPLDDETLTQDALEAACDAELETFGAALRSITFRSRDVNLQPGKIITITLGGTTNISGDFLIQRVLTSEMDIANGLYPLRQVTAGPVLHTLRKTLAA